MPSLKRGSKVHAIVYISSFSYTKGAFQVNQQGKYFVHKTRNSIRKPRMHGMTKLEETFQFGRY